MGKKSLLIDFIYLHCTLYIAPKETRAADVVISLNFIFTMILQSRRGGEGKKKVGTKADKSRRE